MCRTVAQDRLDNRVMYPHLNTNSSHMVAERGNGPRRRRSRGDRGRESRGGDRDDNTKGDDYRHLAELAARDAKYKAAKDACVAYAEASKMQIIEHVVEVSQIQYQEVVRQVPVPQPFVQTVEQPYPISQIMTQGVMIPMTRPYDEHVDVQYANHIVQTVEETMEVPQVQYSDRIVDLPVVMQRRVPTVQTAQRTVEVPQTIEVPKIVSQDRIPQRIAEQAMDTPVPQVIEELLEVFNVFLQNRVQQQIMEQTTETPAVSLAEEIIYCLKEDQSEFLEELIIEKSDVTVPHVMEKTIDGVKTIPQERVQNCTVEQIIDVPVVQQGRVPTTQTVQKMVEESQVQFPDRVVDVPVVTQRYVPLKVPQIQFIDKAMNVPVIVQRQVPIVQKVQKTVEVPQTQFHRQGSGRPSAHAEASSSSSSCAENRGGPTDSVH